jgi:hypothetical protein
LPSFDIVADGSASSWNSLTSQILSAGGDGVQSLPVLLANASTFENSWNASISDVGRVLPTYGGNPYGGVVGHVHDLVQLLALLPMNLQAFDKAVAAEVSQMKPGETKTFYIIFNADGLTFWGLAAPGDLMPAAPVGQITITKPAPSRRTC